MPDNEPKERAGEPFETPTDGSKTDSERVADNTSHEAAEVSAEPQVVLTKKPGVSKRLVLLGVAAVVIVAIGGSLAWYMASRSSTVQGNKTTTGETGKESKVTKSKMSAEDAQILAKLATPTTGETWLATPKQVADLGYLHHDPVNEVTDEYYQMGARGQNIIYMSVTVEMGESYALFEKTPDGTVYLIAHPSASEEYDAKNYDAYIAQWLDTNVKVDKTTRYDSLTLPTSFDIGNGETAKTDFVGYMEIGQRLQKPASDTTKKVLKTYGSSKLVKIERKYVDTGLTAVSYAVDLPTGTELNLSYEPVSLDMSTYTWSNGVKVIKPSQPSDDYSMGAIIRGCSAATTAVSRADGVADADFVTTGKTADGKTVYTLKNDNNSLVQKSYDEYADFYKDDTHTTVVPLAEFLKQHAVVAYKNAQGEWLVYTRNKFAAIGGCAKPVVYLYPTRTQAVSVKVGANIIESIPAYNAATGWRVMASPNGTLKLGGTTYDSLFWEGYGIGMYPGIVGGTVVKHADAAATMAAQLKQQGLNAKEASDFMSFWEPRIPNKPYVRLTWFTTSQMNQLAPLYVSPKPDTLIRVFLDMDGYDEPMQLPAQQLHGTSRQGFTVVEWGGLSESKLH